MTTTDKPTNREVTQVTKIKISGAAIYVEGRDDGATVSQGNSIIRLSAAEVDALVDVLDELTN